MSDYKKEIENKIKKESKKKDKVVKAEGVNDLTDIFPQLSKSDVDKITGLYEDND